MYWEEEMCEYIEVLVGRQFGIYKRKWGNIKMYLKEMGGADTEWITWAQARDKWRANVNSVKSNGAQYNAGNFLTS